MNWESTCFVEMPFGKKRVGQTTVDFDVVFERLVKPALALNNWTAARADTLDLAGDISSQITKQLSLSKFALFDITSGSPNVLYSLGYRDACCRPLTLMISQSDAIAPFDLRNRLYVPYSKVISERDVEILSNQIRKMLEAERRLNPSATEADVFLSYKSEYRDRVSNVADYLRNEGFLVWWDPHLQTNSESYSDQIFTALEHCKSVVVFWSEEAFLSHWVAGEASYALEQNKLVQARLTAVSIRPPFNMLQTADLSGGDGTSTEVELRKLISSVRSLVRS